MCVVSVYLFSFRTKVQLKFTSLTQCLDYVVVHGGGLLPELFYFGYYFCEECAVSFKKPPNIITKMDVSDHCYNMETVKVFIVGILLNLYISQINTFYNC